MKMKTAMVFGAGAMGNGIAQVCATSGYKVYLCDINMEFAQRGWDGIAAGLAKQVAKGKTTQENMDAIMRRLIPCCDVSLCAEAQIILEAIVENTELKKNLYAQIEEHCADDAIIGTNTSFIPITKLAADLKKPERFVGIHFFNPVYAMKLVEVIKGELTSDTTMDTARAFVEEIRKEHVTILKDAPGFIVNRINFATYAEAYRVMEEGVASIEDIDKAMRLGLNHPMGPFELNDYGGLKTVQDCLATLYALTGDDRFRPVPALDDHVKKGELGKKTGKGWYDYTK